MTQKLREQISALADHELPEGEHELLLRRFTVERSLRLSWERYHLIGEALRHGLPAVDTRGLADRVMAALSEQETAQAEPEHWTGRLLRGVAGMAIAASVAVVGIIGLQHSSRHAGALPSEIVPTTVARGEAAPLNLTNDANWSGATLPVQASLDDSLVDQEGPSPGAHSLHAHRDRVGSKRDAAAGDSRNPDDFKPPRQY